VCGMELTAKCQRAPTSHLDALVYHKALANALVVCETCARQARPGRWTIQSDYPKHSSRNRATTRNVACALMLLGHVNFLSNLGPF